MFERPMREVLPFWNVLQTGTRLDQRAADAAQAEIERKRRPHRPSAHDDDLIGLHRARPR
jgi:hypothetical protein